MTFENSLAFARAQDAADELAWMRAEYLFPETGTLYFAGHSLGLPPRKARQYVLEEMDEWNRLGVEGHFASRNPWVRYHEFLTGPTARIVGAREHEVVVANSLTVNLHLLLVSFYRPTAQRKYLLIEKGAFPSDQYATASQARFHGFPDAVLESDEPLKVLEERGHEIALALIGTPNYLTGRTYPVAPLVKLAHSKGALIGFDLAHGIGNLEFALHDDGPDFACWCSYKYLNSGPGGPGGIFVHERHHGAKLPRFEGWWGHDKVRRFEMAREFSPIAGAEAWQLSNPSVLQMAALRASMELFDKAGIKALARKRDKLTGFLDFVLREQKFEIRTPADHRGAMISLKANKSLVDTLHKRGAIVDFRPPDIVRITPIPSYSSFEDVYRLGEELRKGG
jgi:kynureninase